MEDEEDSVLRSSWGEVLLDEEESVLRSSYWGVRVDEEDEDSVLRPS